MRARPSTLLVLLGLPLALGTAPGCGKQGEGERCDAVGSGSGDCESTLDCVPSDQLVGNLPGTGVCCPKPGQQITAPNCQPSSGFAGASGADDAGEGAAGTTTGGSGGQADAATDGAAESEAACSYNSDCPVGQVCGPLGRCQVECETDRDCESPRVCVNGACTLSGSGTDSATDSSMDSSIDSSIDSSAE